MNRGDAIKKVEEYVPHDEEQHEAREELLRYLKCEDKPSPQPVFDSVVLELSDVCEFLIHSGCGIDEINTCLDEGYWWSPLMYAIKLGNKDIFSLLLENGADIHYWATEQEQCPLGVAVEYGRTEMFFELVRRGVPVSVEYFDEMIYFTFECPKEDLLMSAIENRNEKITLFLLEQGCDLNSHVRYSYENFWEYAKRINALDFLEHVVSLYKNKVSYTNLLAGEK